MARTVRISPEEYQQALLLRDDATSVAEYRKALSVILMADHGFDAGTAAALLGTSRRTVYRDRKAIRKQDGAPKNTWGGRRRCVLSLDEEKEFLSRWEAEAKAGGVLAVPPVHAALVERLGRKIPLSTTYRILARHGWRKIQPDTRHPKSDRAAQEEFKKNFRRKWLPPA